MFWSLVLYIYIYIYIKLKAAIHVHRKFVSNLCHPKITYKTNLTYPNLLNLNPT